MVRETLSRVFLGLITGNEIDHCLRRGAGISKKKI